MDRHPAGKGRSVQSKRYEVRDGDTLWGIAGRVLGSDDPAAIARFWPKLHRLNRATIGPNPNLLRPGQILHLPSASS